MKSPVLHPVLSCVTLISLLALVATAQTTRPAVPDNRGEPIPPELKDVGIDEHLNAQIPLDLTFTDDQGKTVRIGDYFKAGRPVILQLGYYGCPMLCGLVTNAMMDSMKELPLALDKDYAVVNVSIDPEEDWKLAKAKKQNYLKELGKSGGESGWHFLVGSQKNIKQLTSIVGFKYKWNDETKQYAHAAAIFVCTPDGRLSHYLFGVQFPAPALQQALTAASQGKFSAADDKVLFPCLQGGENKNAQMAIMYMRLGGALTVIVLAIVILRQLYRSAHLKHRPGSVHG